MDLPQLLNLNYDVLEHVFLHCLPDEPFVHPARTAGPLLTSTSPAEASVHRLKSLQPGSADPAPALCAFAYRYPKNPAWRAGKTQR